MPLGTGSANGGLSGSAESGSGVTATLTLGTPGATSVVATIAVDGGTLIDWDLERTTDGGATWTTFQGPIATASATATIDPETTYVFRAVVRVEAAAISATVSVTSPEQTVLPVAADFAVIAPGGLRGFSTVPEGGEAFLCDVRVPVAGGIQAATVEVYGASTLGAAYGISGLYVGDALETGALTEDLGTGFKTIFSTAKTVAAGTEAVPALTRLTPEGGFSLGGLRSADLRFVVELPEGAEKRMWGVPMESTGWNVDDTNAKLASLPSVSWSMEGRSNPFGQLPNLVFVFRDLNRNVVNVHKFGDSHDQGYGDGGITGTRGLAYRLTDAWAVAAKDIVATQWGIQGRTTPDILTAYSVICAALDVRCALYQAISVNNYNDGFGYADPGAQAISDFAAAQAVNGSQPIWGIIPGTWTVISGDAGKKANYRASVTALKTAHPTLLDQADGGLWDSASMEYLPDIGAGDGAHISSDGYDVWTGLIYAPLTALIEAAE